KGRSRAVLLADGEGVAVGYALFNLQERGTMFVKPGDPVYEGMVVGENARGGDMDVNPSKEKKLTNMRTTASDEMIILEPPRQVTLELALEYIEDDELIEVTPSSIRLRKRALDATERRKLARNARSAEEWYEVSDNSCRIITTSVCGDNVVTDWFGVLVWYRMHKKNGAGPRARRPPPPDRKRLPEFDPLPY